MLHAEAAACLPLVPVLLAEATRLQDEGLVPLPGRPPPLFTPGQGREVQGSELFQAARTSVWSARRKLGWFGHSS